MKLLDQLKQMIQGARAGIEQLNAAIQQLRDNVAAATKTHQELADAPPPADEVVDSMCDLVDAIAARKAGEWRYRFVRECGGGLTLQDDGTYSERRPAMPRLIAMHGATLDDLIALFPDHAKARLETIIRSEAYASPGSMRDRPALLAAAALEIRRAEDEHTALVDLAAELDPPIVLPLLEPVRQRRETARLKAEREAAGREARHQAEAAVNQQELVARRGHGGRSAYLESNSMDAARAGLAADNRPR